MNVYENIVIYDASITDEAIEEAISKVSDIVAANNGEMLKVEQWGKRKLSYEINKHARGHYSMYLFTADGTVVKGLEKFYRITDNVVKFMCLNLEKKQKAAALRSLEEAKAKAEAAAKTEEEVKTEEAPSTEEQPTPEAAEQPKAE